MAPFGGLAHAWGLARSLGMYYGHPGRSRRMRALYASFVRPGDLCFDIGAHVGSRTRCFRSLGARVVAVEPQPRLASFLRLLFAGDAQVELLPVAVGAAPGTVELHVSAATPTVSSGSKAFLAAVAPVPSFGWVKWEERVRVPVITLDELVERRGLPSFVKIDVEGMEAEVLEGLSRPVPALSFEVVPAFKANARRCLDRLGVLGDWRYNASIGESQRLLFEGWVDRGVVEAWLDGLPAEGDSGDVYARLEGAA